jgi:hypothetical protein
MLPNQIEDKIMKTKTAALLTMMAPTIASHANAGIQMTDWSMMRDIGQVSRRLMVVDQPTNTVEKPKIVAVSTTLGKKIGCSATKGDEVVTANGLTELLRQLGYSRDEMWGKQDKLEWAWYRINNAKFKRGEPVEFEGRIFIKSSI